jgi:hypothetical protein
MTPELLAKIESLVKAGAVIAGQRPLRSPSLVNYPACDAIVTNTSRKMWGVVVNPEQLADVRYHGYGHGTIIYGGDVNKLDGPLYPYYETIASILKELKYTEDFTADAPVRYTHRTSPDWDIYFVSNTSGQTVDLTAKFRTVKGSPELWNAVTGNAVQLDHFSRNMNTTSVPLKLHGYESCFVVFSKDMKWKGLPGTPAVKSDTLKNLSTDWDVSFDPKWGGPAHVVFKKLEDWSQMQDEGIKYYSGTAIYTKKLDWQGSTQPNAHVYLDLGDVKNMARVTINGKEIGVLWTAPWRIDIGSYLHKGDNELKIEVINLWSNRLIGDEKLADDGPRDGKWPDWLLNGKPRPGKRYTFTTTEQYNADSPLQRSGLIGPVYIISEQVVH